MDIHGLNYTLGEDVNGPLLAAALAVEMIAALIVNTFVLVATFSQCKSLKLPFTILFTSLIMIHYVVALIYIPSWLISAAYGEWIFGSTIQVKEATCNFAGFILNYTLQVKNFTLAAVSVDRWLFIVKPIFYKQYIGSCGPGCYHLDSVCIMEHITILWNGNNCFLPFWILSTTIHK